MAEDHALQAAGHYGIAAKKHNRCACAARKPWKSQVVRHWCIRSQGLIGVTGARNVLVGTRLWQHAHLPKWRKWVCKNERMGQLWDFVG